MIILEAIELRKIIKMVTISLARVK